MPPLPTLPPHRLEARPLILGHRPPPSCVHNAPLLPVSASIPITLPPMCPLRPMHPRDLSPHRDPCMRPMRREPRPTAPARSRSHPAILPSHPGSREALPGSPRPTRQCASHPSSSRLTTLLNLPQLLLNASPATLFSVRCCPLATSQHQPGPFFPPSYGEGHPTFPSSAPPCPTSEPCTSCYARRSLPRERSGATLYCAHARTHARSSAHSERASSES
ncbi:hypothetical protein C8Q73DRAFT_242155 [Cubamyces lactineus]|nr:hypothetical protein C8Q73DRAFT_242155 [Cubamyces lactineus]